MTGLGRILVLLSAVVFVAVVFTLLARVEPIEVINSRLSHEGNQVFVQGTVRNSGSDTGAVNLEVRYYDSQGRKLVEDKVALPPLRSGAEEKFRTTARDLQDVRDFTIIVDRGRNPYGN